MRLDRTNELMRRSAQKLSASTLVQRGENDAMRARGAVARRKLEAMRARNRFDRESALDD